ncbi:MAG: glycosyltransferase, partial [Chitinophagaceae bacterium]
FKLARLTNSYFKASFLAERAQARAYDELLRAAKKIKADLYIGHNLGALAVAVKAAMYHNAKAGFDFEDYHRGEFHLKDKNVRRVVWLENKYLPALSYYSTSSPLIAEAIKNDHKKFAGKTITLLNCFPLTHQPPFQQKTGKSNTLTLFWFSQTIGSNRGLETVIEALKMLNDPGIRLILAGRCNNSMSAYLEKNKPALASPVQLVGMIQPEKLPAYAAQFDVGIATELNEPQNRNFCLTNKLFTYLLAGNAILASDTAAQTQFINEMRNVGFIYERQNAESLAQKIKWFRDNRAMLMQQRTNAYAWAQKQFTWEKESQKLIQVCRSLLS